LLNALIDSATKNVIKVVYMTSSEVFLVLQLGQIGCLVTFKLQS